MQKGMTIMEMMIVLAVVAFFILGIASPFLVGTRDEATQVMAKNMEGDLNNHYNQWLAAGGILEGRPKTSDLLVLFSSTPGVNKVVKTDGDETSSLKDNGYSSNIRLNIPEEIKPKKNAPSHAVVASDNYVVQFNNDTGQFSVSSNGGGTQPTTGGTSPTTGGTSPGTGPGTDPGTGPGGGTDPGPGGTNPGGGGPTIPNEPHQQTGGISAYMWVPTKAPGPGIYDMVIVPGYHPSTHAAASKLRPAGHAAILIGTGPSWNGWMRFNTYGNSTGDPADKIRNPDGTLTSYQDPWMTQAIKNIRDGVDPHAGDASWEQGVDEWFRKYASAGGKVDYLLTDWEGFYGFWYNAGTDDQFYIYDEVMALYSDPRFPSIAGNFPLLSQLHPTVPNYAARMKFTLAMMDMCNDAIRQAIFEPVKKYFPNAHTSNYLSYIMTANNNVPIYSGGTDFNPATKAGTDNAPSLYGTIGDLQNVKLAGGVPFGNSSFARVLWQVNYQRGIQRSSSAPVTPWIAYRSYSPGNPVMERAYYKDYIRHLAMSGAHAILVWNAFATADDDAAISEAIADTNSRVGTGWRYPLSLQGIPWDSQLIVSGMKIEGGKTVYRVTAVPGVTAVRANPGGQVIFLNGDSGIWYESATGETMTFAPVL